MQGFLTDTVLIDLHPFQFGISEENIHRFGIHGEEVSKGLLVKDHFTTIYHATIVAGILKDGKCKEAMACWYIEDQKEYDEAPTLERCVFALEKQINEICEGKDTDRYRNEISRIECWLDDLRNGRWYKSGPAYDRPGVPRIETTGDRLYSALLDLVWKLDNDEKSSFEEMVEALRKFDKTAEKVIPDFNPKDWE